MQGQEPQQCFLVPLLVGTDGNQKMSKSLGNAIGVNDSPNDQYGKIMSLRDELIVTYFDLLTDLENSEVNEIDLAIKSESVNPIDLKKRLALEIVKQFHNAKAAEEAKTEFERVVQRGEAPEEMEPVNLKTLHYTSLSHMLVAVNLATSVSEAKRLISQGAVEVNGNKIPIDYALDNLQAGDILKAGRRRFVKFIDVQKK